MEYTVEDLSPVKKKIAFAVDAKEVEAAIMATVSMYRTSVQMDGFRKGKVPASVIEQRFRDKIYEEAKQDLVNVHINSAMAELKLTPVSSITFDGLDMKRGEDFNYSISFEVLPAFALPMYEGMEVQQEKAVVDEKEVEEVLQHLLRKHAKLEPVDGEEPAKDGQIAVIDFAAFLDGKPLEGISAQNFELSLGERQALQEFEDLVKTIPYGQEREGEITFPSDFLASDLAGKTVTMKVKVHAVKERKMPELNDELAKKLGFDSVEKIHAVVRESTLKSRERLNKAAAQKILLDRLLKMVEFPLPEAMVETYIRTLIADRKAQLERQGKGLDALGKSLEELRAEVRPEAEDIARAEVFLLTVAHKEGLEVPQQEVDMQIYQLAQQAGVEYTKFKEDYVNSGMVFTLRDRMLADKGMEAIYDKAKVVEVEPAAAATDA